MPTLAALYIYPVKSCRGIHLSRAQLAFAGLAHDREWLVVGPDRRFLTQRDTPRLALISPAVANDTLTLDAPGMASLVVSPQAAERRRCEVTVWNDRCAAFDEGDGPARWLTQFLGRDARLVRFDPSRPRPTDPQWSQGLAGQSRFPDAYPLLVLSQGSLDDLNRRLPKPLPVDRFRPNLLLTDCEPYAEDRLATLEADGVRLRLVKPCTRCVITTTDQATAERDGEEPLRTLKTYRWNRALRGVAFGQNALVEAGDGSTLEVGMQLR